MKMCSKRFLKLVDSAVDPLATIVISQTTEHEGDFLGFNDLFTNVVISLFKKVVHSKACDVH
jgi:hypothetical protein